MKTDKLLKELRKQVEKDFGKRCKDFSPLCPTCVAYESLEDLEYLFDYDEFK